jgi:hypothetical protein
MRKAQGQVVVKCHHHEVRQLEAIVRLRRPQLPPVLVEVLNLRRSECIFVSERIFVSAYGLRGPCLVELADDAGDGPRRSCPLPSAARHSLGL